MGGMVGSVQSRVIFLLALMMGVSGPSVWAMDCLAARLALMIRPRLQEISQKITEEAEQRSAEESRRKALINRGLLHAVRNCDGHNVLQALVWGADVESVSRDGDTPLLLASLYDHTDLAQLLLCAGASSTHANKKNGITPLIRATTWGRVSLVELLLAYGAGETIDHCDKIWGETALMHAAHGRFCREIKRQEHTEIIRLLVAAGASLFVRSHEGQRMAIAYAQGHAERKVAHTEKVALLKEAAVDQLLVCALPSDLVMVAWYWANLFTAEDYPVWPGEFAIASRVSTLNPAIDALPTNKEKIACIRDATLYDDNNPDPRVKRVLEALVLASCPPNPSA